jgi:hypothetical protein
MARDILCIPGVLLVSYSSLFQTYSISRFCCRRWEDILRWSWHNLPLAC